MPSTTMSRLLVALLVASIALLLGANAGLAAADRLVVTQDESSMERAIESYLTSNHNLIVNEKMIESDDLTLEVPFKGDPMPAFRVVIDTQPDNRDKDTNRVIERAILVVCYTSIKVPPERRGAVMDVINDYNRKKLFASVYIDTDGEIVCGWNLNVLEEGLATEYVYDAVARVQNIWRGLYPDVSGKL